MNFIQLEYLWVSDAVVASATRVVLVVAGRVHGARFHHRVGRISPGKPTKKIIQLISFLSGISIKLKNRAARGWVEDGLKLRWDGRGLLGFVLVIGNHICPLVAAYKAESGDPSTYWTYVEWTDESPPSVSFPLTEKEYQNFEKIKNK
jgi:hypothetical protein